MDPGRHDRYAATLATYEELFRNKPPPLAWESLEEAKSIAAVDEPSRDMEIARQL
jgi:hypothetical protein